MTQRGHRSRIKFDENSVHRKKTQHMTKRKISEGGSVSIDSEPFCKSNRLLILLGGLSILGIMREIEQRGITFPSGKTKWCRRSIDLMLENEKYRGNSVATAPTMSDAPKDLPRRRYMLSMHHEGIISSEQFDDVQKERERRSNIEFDDNGVHRKKMQYRTKLKISEDGSISVERGTE